MEERSLVRSVIYKNLFLFLFFLIFYVVIYSFTFLENLNDCFPATVITTDREQVDRIVNGIDLCYISVETEKMTFDSAIFNHYETPPVKDVFLFSISMPYEKWDLLKSLENAISDTNPYVENTVVVYNSSRIKFLSVAFIIISLIWLLFSTKTVPSWRRSKHDLFVTVIFTSINFVLLSTFSYLIASPKVHSFITITLSLFLITYIIILAIIYRLISTGEIK